MINYFRSIEFVIYKLWFYYLNGCYKGRGVLKWGTKEGFHLEAFVKRYGSKLSSKIEFGRLGLTKRGEYRTIFMKSRGFKWIIAPYVLLRDRYDLINDNRLSINFNRVLFSFDKSLSSDFFISALYEYKNMFHMPDSIESEKKIKGISIERSISSALQYKDEKLEILGRFLTDNFFEINVNLNKYYYNKIHSWHWATGIKDAISILLGEDIRLLKREVHRGNRKYIEFFKRIDIESLDLFSLFSSTFSLDKEKFLRLADFFVKNDSNAYICKNIFDQLLVACSQKNWQARELLLSTILEASLRTIYKQSIEIVSKRWRVDPFLKQFKGEYLSKEWRSCCNIVLKNFRFLRTRNAHPDWLISENGGLSEELREKSLDAMIFLSRFYGYMILALAGFKGLKPVFPKPLKEWHSPVTIESRTSN